MHAKLVKRILDLAVTIQQIPGPTFGEAARAAFMTDQFNSLALEDVSTDKMGNVYGRLPGAGAARPLIVSAHIDTVFSGETDLKISRAPGRISGPGIGDNSLAAAGLCGLVWALQEQRRSLPGDLWLVANVAEEGLGDLAGMRAVVDRFGQQPLAYLALEGMGYGRVYHRGLGVRRYRVTVNTQGGHSWVDFGKPSAIHELAAFITQLNTIILPVFPRTTLNAGVISGGTSVNTIASQAEIQLDLRSEDHAQLERLSTIVKDMVKSANREGVLVSAKVIGDRQAAEIGVNHVLVKLAQRVLENQGVKADLNIGSTDANVPLSRGLPAICIGLTRGGKAHTTREYIHTRPVKSGMEQLLGIVQGAYEALTQGPIREK